MNPNVQIVRSTTEDCPHSVKQCLTLYFIGAPTIKQIMHCAERLAMGHRVKPNFKSRQLRVYTTQAGDLVRCQVAD